MKQTAVEWQFEQLFNSFEKFNNMEYSFNEYLKRNLEIREQAKKIEEDNLLEMLHKFGFDYAYNYKGEKTIYEWIPEWFEDYKRLNNLKTNNIMKNICSACKKQTTAGPYPKWFCLRKNCSEYLKPQSSNSNNTI